MTKLRFDLDWHPTNSGSATLRTTSAFLTMHVDDQVVTYNKNTLSNTLTERVLVSTYPLAMWLAFSWWRLNWEPLPPRRMQPHAPWQPDAQWRMAHEMGAANEGYVWPHVTFTSDTNMMRIRVAASASANMQSVRYITSVDTLMPLEEFRTGIDTFINTVLSRLSSEGQSGSDLEHLWQLVQEDRNSAEASRYRSIEAALGYDPDEAPGTLMQQAVKLDQEMGGNALVELAPVYGRFGTNDASVILSELHEQSGMLGCPALPQINANLPCTQAEPPWRHAVAAARALRKEIDAQEGKIESKQLLELLGLPESALQHIGSSSRSYSSLGIPQQANQYKFIPRKRHPVARRFELARFIADLIQVQDAPQWLTSTDLYTARQKFQRAFAAEFLCPIEQLSAFFQDDDFDIDQTATHFDVSPETIRSLLTNNGLLSPQWDPDHFQST